MKRKIYFCCFLIIYFTSFFIFPQRNYPSNIHELLISRGYDITPYVVFHHPTEYKITIEKYGKTECDKGVELNEGQISYEFIFLRKNEVNESVFAYILDEYGERILNPNTGEGYVRYYKINAKNEPPNLWLSMDINGDGAITEGEGRNAWY